MLNIAKPVSERLKADNTVSSLTGGRVFFMTSPNTTRRPYVGFDYEVSCNPSDKDTMFEDSAAVDVIAVADSSSVMMELADAVRGALDGFTSEKITKCVCTGASFETEDNLYASTIRFTITSTK